MNTGTFLPSAQLRNHVEDALGSAGDERMARVPVLHLMHSVVDTSITNIVLDQLKHFGNRDYDWHIGGLHGVEMYEPFSQMNAKVVDFSTMVRRKTQLPGVVRAYVRDHGIRIIHTHTPRTTVVAALALGFSRPAKMVTTKHLHAVSQERGSWGWLFTLVDRCATYMPDEIVAVSNDVGQRIRALPWVRPDRVSVIQNAVDIETYYAPEQRESCRAEFDIAPQSPVLGFAGRITQQKRVDLLLQAFAQVLNRYPMARLLIAGNGEEESKLQAYSRQLGVGDRVIWAGYRRDIPRLMAATDIYVQSSVNEGLSLSLLQAMAARKPVVATDVGGTREVVNERTGILIPAGSSSRIAEAVIRLLDTPEETAMLVTAASELLDRQFTVRRQMEEYQRIYKSVLSPRGLAG